MDSNAQIDVNDPVFFLIIALVALVLLSPRLAPRFLLGFKNFISPLEVKKRLDTGPDITLLDVRTPTECTADPGHIEGATPAPLDYLNAARAPR